MLFNSFLVHSCIAFNALALELENRFYRLKTYAPATFAPPSRDVVTHHYYKLKRVNAHAPSSRFMGALQTLMRAKTGNTANGVGKSSLQTINGQVYFAQVQFGYSGTVYNVVVDTGSSDTWLVRNTFQCVDPSSGINQTQSYCAFGNTYALSPTWRRIPNEHFNVSYVDGETLAGMLGYEMVTVGGITVNQTVGVVDYAAWYGDGYSSGLMGLAFGAVTSAYSGSNEYSGTNGGNMPYQPIFTTMWQKYGITPVFSMALARPSLEDQVDNGGMIGFGGIPPNTSYTSTFVSTPITMLNIHGTVLSASNTYLFYTIKIGGFAYAGSKTTPSRMKRNSKSTSTPVERAKAAAAATPTNAYDPKYNALVDSGTTLMYVPSDIAADLANLFNPPATFDDTYGLYMTACNAKIPKFGVYIAGKIFFVNPLDLLQQQQGAARCALGVQPEPGITVLGDTFLRNVLVVFDIGAGQMRFAAR